MEKRFGDSKLYRAVYNSYQELKGLEDAPVSQKAAQSMEKAMKSFRKACEAYLEKREGFLTERGQERYEEIETLYKQSLDKEYMIEMSREAIGSREYDGKSWDDANQRRIDKVTMERLEKVIQEKKEEMAGLESQEISLETAMKMTKASQDIKESCREYLERESRVKQEGKKPEEMKNLLESLEKRNLDSLRDVKKLKEYEGKTWQEVKEVPLSRLEASPGKIEKTGGNASIRLKLEKDGKKGFFTEAKGAYEDIGKIFDQYIENVQDTALKDKLLENRQVIVQAGDIQHVANLSKAIEHARKQFTGDKEGLKKDGKLMRCIGEMYMESRRFYNTKDALKTHEGDKITLRNVATTRMADLLGVERLIAHSEIVEVKIGDRVVKGSFMDYAEGYDANSLDIDTVQKLKEVKAWDSPEMLRDSHDLEIFDLICGQNDRHGANAFYKVGEMGPDGTRPALGIMGIDNDLSFGSKVRLDEKGTLMTSGKTEDTQHIRFVSEDLADKIMDLNREKLEYAVGDLISKEQMDALELRTEKMKELIQAQMYKVKEDGWNLDQYSKDDPSPEAKKYIEAANAARERATKDEIMPLVSNNLAGVARDHAKKTRKEVEAEREAYRKGLDGIDNMFDEAEKEAEVYYEWEKAEQKKENKREKREYMTQMESVKNMFEAAGKEKTETDKKQKISLDELAEKENGKKKNNWTFAAKASQKERKTDISISAQRGMSK